MNRDQIVQALEMLVPDEGIEPPTFGLQNRCSTAELIRPGVTSPYRRDLRAASLQRVRA
jgi:hypothetical protein